MKKFVLFSFVAFCLSGCVISEDEIKISELLCKAEGSTVKEINKQGQAVRCANGKLMYLDAENTYNAMLVLAKKGEL